MVAVAFRLGSGRNALGEQKRFLKGLRGIEGYSEIRLLPLKRQGSGEGKAKRV